MKHARTSLAALAGAVVLTGTFAVGSVSALAASGGAPASRHEGGTGHIILRPGKGGAQ